MTVRAHAATAVRLPPRFLKSVSRIVKKVFRSEKKKGRGEINVAFVNRKTIRKLNRQFLDNKGDTDVIAFPYVALSPIRPLESTSVAYGDIYICAAVGAENARRYDEPVARELTRLVVHGTLHLLGYADSPKKARDKMWARQEPIVDALWRKKS